MRAFSWFDVLSLYQNRKQLLVLDNELLITHGNPLGAVALLEHFNPERESFTGVSSTQDGEITLIGQIYRSQGERAARIAYLSPVSACSTSALPALIEEFTKQAGMWGAFHLLAEVNERSVVFGCLKRAGFSVYTWQNIWKLYHNKNNCHKEKYWQPAVPADEISINSLFHGLVPPLVQRAQQLTNHYPQGFVYYQNHEMLGYVEVINGSKGVYLLPLIHPKTENINQLITDLCVCIHSKSRRPVYLAVRSYQSWLENSLQEMDFEVSPRQAMMVRYLTNVQRALFQPSHQSVIDGRKAETSTLLPNCVKDK